MKVLEHLDAVRAWREAATGSVGLVPTMGYLHDGHLALVRAARATCDHVAASIFVNPAQFDRAEDLTSYPRDLARDLAMLEAAGCDVVATPSAQALYPPGFDTWVEPGRVAEPNEGAHRPGHFRGVATVVLKLFNLVQPTRAYFGQKDAQQLAVVRALVRDLDVPVAIEAIATVRESDGLAMSSRNSRLSTADRAAAPVLHRALRSAYDAWRDGTSDAETLRARMGAVLAGEPRAEVEYTSVADPDSLTELDQVSGPALLSLAARFGNVRLIDNLPIPNRDPDGSLER